MLRTKPFAVFFLQLVTGNTFLPTDMNQVTLEMLTQCLLLLSFCEDDWFASTNFIETLHYQTNGFIVSQITSKFYTYKINHSKFRQYLFTYLLTYSMEQSPS
jgi:hypothetical protein